MIHRGLLVGRFQPPHLGHLELINHILKDVDELIIAVAASQLSHSEKNPFTAGERITMIRMMLHNANVDLSKILIIPTNDIKDNSLWVSHLKRLIPSFSTFYSNNPFTRMLFEEAGISVLSTPCFERTNLQASKVRQLLYDNLDASKFLDESVQTYLDHKYFKNRFKGINETDKK